MAFAELEQYEVKPVKYVLVKSALLRLQRRTHAYDTVDQAGALRTGHQSDVGNSVRFEKVEFTAKAIDAAFRIFFKGDQTGVPVIGPDKSIRSAISIKFMSVNGDECGRKDWLGQ